jgi:hypothetical protein
MSGCGAKMRKQFDDYTENVNRVTTLMHDLLVHPEDFSKHLDRSTASFSAIALFGQRAKSHDDFWATVRWLTSRNRLYALLTTYAGRLQSHGDCMTWYPHHPESEANHLNVAQRSHKPRHIPPLRAVPNLQTNSQALESRSHPCRRVLYVYHKHMARSSNAHRGSAQPGRQARVAHGPVA